MKSTIQERVLLATMSCLRPLARVLLRCGISYRQFAEAAKNAFLEEAIAERDQRGRLANVSRLAIRTGLSRKEVARLRDARTASAEALRGGMLTSRHSGHAARTLQIWYTDRRFLDEGGTPSDLAYAGNGDTFTALVRLVGGDIPAGAVRAELLGAGAAIELPSGLLRAVKRHFVPGDVDEELVVGLGHIVHPVLEGLARNTGPMKRQPFVQRLAYSDRLIPAAIPLFRQVSREKCIEFVETVDDWLGSHELEVGKDIDEVTRVGVGVFYFEGSPPDRDEGTGMSGLEET